MSAQDRGHDRHCPRSRAVWQTIRALKIFGNLGEAALSDPHHDNIVKPIETW